MCFLVLTLSFYVMNHYSLMGRGLKRGQKTPPICAKTKLHQACEIICILPAPSAARKLQEVLQLAKQVNSTGFHFW